MKNVLVLVHDDTGQEARLQAALDLTRALNGHLDCLDVTPLPLMVDNALGAVPVVIVHDEFEQEAANARKLVKRLAGEDVSWSWSDVRGDFGHCLLESARTADIIVLNHDLERFPVPDMTTLAGQVLARTDALILAVAEDARGFDVAAPALIAWDGSEVAMHALEKAVPLLRLAEAVKIFQVGASPADAIAAEDAAAYLSRHGIKPELEIEAREDEVADRVCVAARAFGAGYCVMGAYGHSRLREALFGGVTCAMLRKAKLPVLLGR